MMATLYNRGDQSRIISIENNSMKCSILRRASQLQQSKKQWIYRNVKQMFAPHG